MFVSLLSYFHLGTKEDNWESEGQTASKIPSPRKTDVSPTEIEEIFTSLIRGLLFMVWTHYNRTNLFTKSSSIFIKSSVSLKIRACII